MTVTPKIPGTFPQMLFEHLDALGVPAHEVMPAGLTPAHCLAPQGLAVTDWVSVLDRAAERLADPCLGLHVGQRITPRHLGPLGYLMLAMPTLAAALHKLNQYQRLVYDITPMKVRVRPEAVELVWDADHGRPGRLSDDTAIAALIHFARQIADGPALTLRQVDFINPSPPSLQPYLDFFGCPVRFDQPETVLSILPETMFRPLKGSDPDLTALMEAQVAQRLASLPSAHDLVDALRRAIGQHLRQGEPGLSDIAQALGRSTRTLQRELAACGTAFNTELAAVRLQMAESYLLDPRLSLSDVAQLLGYSEHSAFTRAFRAATGHSPRDWRRARSGR